MSSTQTERSPTGSDPRRQLLSRHLAGDSTAFPEFMAQYRKQVYGLVVRMGVAESFRDDVFQECFIKIHFAAGKYSSERPLEPWMFTIVQNTVRTHFRKQKVREIVEARDELPEMVTVDEAGELDARETAAWLEREIAKLPEMQRDVVCLCGVKDLCQQDVAEILAIPVNTVKTHLSRARATLAKALARRNASARKEVAL